MKQLPLGVQLRASAVFESFAPGANEELLAALRASDPTPLWIWGAPGSGKTHLLQALCAAAGADASAAQAAYFPLDRGSALPPEALAGFEHAPLLCIDDADAVAGDAAWEQALFHVFNAAADFDSRLVFTAAAPPRQITWALRDFSSRAAACVVYQLKELDDAGRAEALRLRGLQRGLHLPEETCEYLLKRVARDLPSLFDILDTLDTASLAQQRRLTIPFIRTALEKRADTKS